MFCPQDFMELLEQLRAEEMSRQQQQIGRLPAGPTRLGQQ